MANPVYVNTSNPGKLQEYRQYFKDLEVISQDKDIDEPDADPETIIRYKASQFDNVIVDDVSLDVVGAEVGTKIRFLLPRIRDYLGKEATYVCRLAIRVNDAVHVYTSAVKGRLVEPRGEAFGFGKYFLPKGAKRTLGEYMNPRFNARFLAIKKFKTHKPDSILPLLKDWDGPFQEKQPCYNILYKIWAWTSRWLRAMSSTLLEGPQRITR